MKWKIKMFKRKNSTNKLSRISVFNKEQLNIVNHKFSFLR